MLLHNHAAQRLMSYRLLSAVPPGEAKLAISSDTCATTDEAKAEAAPNHPGSSLQLTHSLVALWLVVHVCDGTSNRHLKLCMFMILCTRLNLNQGWGLERQAGSSAL